MGYFDDTSGLYGDTTNNAAADFTRLNDSNPGQFGNSIFDKLFKGRTKKEVQQEALATSAAPDTVTASPSPVAPAPRPAAKTAADPTDPAVNSSLSSGSGLVRRILGQVMGPPTHNQQGEGLVPGTPFTTKQFMEQLHKSLATPPAMPDGSGAGTAPFNIPQFPNPQPPQRAEPSPHGGGTFGGGKFGGNTFGGQQFGASAMPPPQSPAAGPVAGPAAGPVAGPAVGGNGMGLGSPPQGPMTPMPSQPGTPMDLLRSLPQRYTNVAPPGSLPMPNQSSVGYFRGGALRLMRGGYPEHLMMGLPTRAEGGPMQGQPHMGGEQGAVPLDGQGDGRSDHVDAKLSPGEFVEDAETVALMGNGDSEAGARGYEAIRQAVRKEKGKALAQGKFSPNAKSAGYYAKLGMKAAAKGNS